MNAERLRSTLILSICIGAPSALAPQLLLAQESGISEQATIVITGERVERSLQETSSSVVVFDELRLSEQAGADRIEKILEQTPNIQMGASDVGVTIRGQDTTGVLLGANAFFGGTRPRATLQLDGRALNFNEFIYGLTSLWDVEQIEVYRGPQTTTQGRNAIAGAIFVETKDPTFHNEGAGRVILGNYDTQQASFALSGPIVDNELAARVAIDWRQHQSWMKFTADDVFVGANRNDDNFATARAKLLYTPSTTPELEMLLTYTHLDATSPQGEMAHMPYEDRVQNTQSGGHYDTDVDSLVLDTDYAINEDWSVSLTGTYADSFSERFAAPGFGTADIEADEYSIEGLLHFAPKDGNMRGLFGVSYFVADQQELSDFSAFLGMGDFDDKQHSVGVFGELTYDINPTLHFTAGGRWQRDSQERKGNLGAFTLDYDNSFEEFLPKAEIAYDLNDETVIGISAKKGYNPGGSTISYTTGDKDEYDKETLWSYELFSRAHLADGDVILSGNLFYTDYKNAQRSQFTSISPVVVEFDNAPKAKSYGLEVESLWQVSSMVQFRAALGFLETEITETVVAGDPMLGKEFQRSPKFTASLGLNIQPTDPLTIDLSMRHNSSYYSDDANTEALKVDGVTVIDTKASYDFGPVQAFAYIRNLTDETYRVWQLSSTQPSSLGDPREFGIGLEASF